MTAVLHVAPSLDERMGGSVRAPLNVCRYFVDGDVRTEIAATVAADDDLGYLQREYPNVQRVLHPRVAPRHNFRSPALRRWLDSHVTDYDLVEINGIFTFPALYAAQACRRHGVPYFVRPHGQLEPYDLKKHAQAKVLFGRVMVQPMLAGAARVLLTTETERENLVTFGTDPVRAVIPLPVQEPTGDADPDGFRARWGIPSTATVVLFLGRFERKKGLDLLCQALVRVQRDHPDVWFVLVGGGERGEVAAARAILSKSGVEKFTTDCGFLSGADKRSAYAAADIFALPSRYENFGIAVVEAMYAGKALLLSDGVYTHDVPAAAGAAEICKPTSESCEAALRRLLKEPRRLVEMGALARTAAHAHFAPVTATQMLKDLYVEVLRGVHPHASLDARGTPS